MLRVLFLYSSHPTSINTWNSSRQLLNCITRIMPAKLLSRCERDYINEVSYGVLTFQKCCGF